VTASIRRPRILMVTGTYHPEVNGAVAQCRQLVRGLSGEADFEVLTTSRDVMLPREDTVDGAAVHRVPVDVGGRAWRLKGLRPLTTAFLQRAWHADIVHFHGVSSKALLLVPLARLLGCRIVITLTSVGHDDAVSIRRHGRLPFRLFGLAHTLIGLSPRFEQAHHDTGLDDTRFTLIPNGVDLQRFRPADDDERTRLRGELGLPDAGPLILFVGHFSHEKGPQVLYEAWTSTPQLMLASSLLFIGATDPRRYEVEAGLAASIRDDAAARGVVNRVAFVEATHEIERYYRAADLFVLPSFREGLPNALLEAMGSGLACITSRLEGITDTTITDGDDGMLVPPGDTRALAGALTSLVTQPAIARRLGRNARATIERRFSREATLAAHRALYGRLMRSLAPVAERPATRPSR